MWEGDVFGLSVHSWKGRSLCSGRSKEGCKGRAPPVAQNFFIFMQFSGKIGQIIGWRPPLGLAPPPLGNPGSATAGPLHLGTELHSFPEEPHQD